jgi:hypothetical protein
MYVYVWQGTCRFVATNTNIGTLKTYPRQETNIHYGPNDAPSALIYSPDDKYRLIDNDSFY